MPFAFFLLRPVTSCPVQRISRFLNFSLNTAYFRREACFSVRHGIYYTDKGGQNEYSQLVRSGNRSGNRPRLAHSRGRISLPGDRRERRCSAFPKGRRLERRADGKRNHGHLRHARFGAARSGSGTGRTAGAGGKMRVRSFRRDAGFFAQRGDDRSLRKIRTAASGAGRLQHGHALYRRHLSAAG